MTQLIIILHFKLIEQEKKKTENVFPFQSADFVVGEDFNFLVHVVD